MATLVVDASVALAWALPDEISAYADAALAVVETEGLRVPELWPREIANGLAIAYLRKRLTLDVEEKFVAALARLTIDVDQSADALAIIRDGTATARQYGLTAYDAAYVELAVREGLALATLDGRMRDAALKAGVVVFEANADLQQ
jgi:predicted nucleic acid-binding protein